MGGWVNLLGLVGLVLIVTFIIFLVCRYLGGWRGQRSWVSSHEKARKGIISIGRLGRIFSPNNTMVQSESELNLSSRGSFRGFEKSNLDTGLIGGRMEEENSIPPQPLRPAPFPPEEKQRNSGGSVGSTLFGGTDNEPPPPKIPPPPKGTERSRNPFMPHISSTESVTLTMSSGRSEGVRGGLSMGELLFSSQPPGETEAEFLVPTETELVQMMREEIRVENERMRVATKDLLGDAENVELVDEESREEGGEKRDKIQVDSDGRRKISVPEIGNEERGFYAVEETSVSGPRTDSLPTSIRQGSLDSMGDSFDLGSPDTLPFLQRAMSCDSVSSDTSIVLGDSPNITGFLSIGLEYDSETADLMVSVIEGKELVGLDPDPTAPFDSYVRVYLLPDKRTNMQTRIYRKSTCPVYKEKFMFGLEVSEIGSRTLAFHLYATNKFSNTLLGEAEMRLAEFDIRNPTTKSLPLTDTGQRGGEFGEVMFSLSYLPTAERLTVVIVKARNLKFPQGDTGDPFVKVYLLQKGKKVSKKKSSTKRGERNPIFNEAMIFSVPTHALQTIQLRISVSDGSELEGRGHSIGHVIVGSGSSGKSLSHWNQMLSSLRKPIGMFHPLRK